MTIPILPHTRPNVAATSGMTSPSATFEDNKPTEVAAVTSAMKAFDLKPDDEEEDDRYGNQQNENWVKFHGLALLRIRLPDVYLRRPGGPGAWSGGQAPESVPGQTHVAQALSLPSRRSCRLLGGFDRRCS